MSCPRILANEKPCGLPVENADGCGWCPECRKRLPLWPTDSAPGAPAPVLEPLDLEEAVIESDTLDLLEAEPEKPAPPPPPPSASMRRLLCKVPGIETCGKTFEVKINTTKPVLCPHCGVCGYQEEFARA